MHTNRLNAIATFPRMLATAVALIAGGCAGESEREAARGAARCEVSRGKHVFITVTGVFNDFPCLAPIFEQPPGHSLEDFLREGAIAGNAPFNPINFDLLVDGAPVDIAEPPMTLVVPRDGEDKLSP